jgi:hypothetical protein
MAKRNKSTKRANDEPGLPSLALVFGYIAVKDLGALEDRVAVLSRLGYGNPEMAAICGSTPASVAVAKHRASKRKAKQ